MKKYSILLFFSLLVISGSLFAQKEPITQIILVRHAEKDAGKNPSLTAEGQARAAKLNEILAKHNIDAVYSTDFNRTIETANPVANGQNLAVETYDPMQPKAFLEQIFKSHKGGTVLVIGHSNTIPQLVNMLLGEEKYEHLEEDAYSDIFIVTIVQGALAKDLHLSY